MAGSRTPNDMAAQAVLSLLGRGSDAGLTQAALADRLGWTKREVKRAVQDLRLDGWLVLSGNDGYWLEGDPTAFLRRQRSQIFSMFATYRAVQRAYRTRGTKQLALFEDAA